MQCVTQTAREASEKPTSKRPSSHALSFVSSSGVKRDCLPCLPSSARASQPSCRKALYRPRIVSSSRYKNSAISAQDLPLSKSKIVFARGAILYSSRWRRKHCSSSSRLAADKKFVWIIYKIDALATNTSPISSDIQGLSVYHKSTVIQLANY